MGGQALAAAAAFATRWVRERGRFSFFKLLATPPSLLSASRSSATEPPEEASRVARRLARRVASRPAPGSPKGNFLKIFNDFD